MKPNMYKILMVILVTVYISSMALPGVAYAIPSTQVGNELTPTPNQEPKRGHNPETGKVSFIGGGDPIKIQGVDNVTGITPEEHAKRFADVYGKEFGLKDPSKELKLLKSEKDKGGNEVVHYQQMYHDVPVIAGELIVNMNSEGEMLSVSGEVSSDLTLDTRPGMKAQEARKAALTEIAILHQVSEKDLTAPDPELWIFDESLLTASTRPVELVWRMEVTAKDATKPIRELVLVNAQTGMMSFHINQIHTEIASQSNHSNSLDTASHEQQAPPLTIASQIQYVDLVIDEARGKLYGADKTGNKVDVIDMADMSITSSYALSSGALPNGIDLSLDGNELAVAQAGSGRVAFINLTTGAISVMTSPLSGSSTRATDVIYGRSGILYALSTRGLHAVDVTATPHLEITSQYVQGSSFEERLGAISSDKNTLYFVTGTCCSGYNQLYKFNVSAELTKPTQLAFTYLYQSSSTTNIRLSLADDSTLLTAWGSVYDTSTLTLKAKNGHRLLPVIALPGRSFYAVAYNSPADPDALYFFDEESSYQLASLDLETSGTPGAMAVSDDGNTLFVSSTAGMTKVEIGLNPPGSVISPPASLHQYRDFVFDMTRGVVYGTDASGRVDLIDQATGAVVNSFLLPNGAEPIGIDLSPDGNELAVAMNGLESILFLDPEIGSEIARVKPLNNNEVNLPYDVIYGRTGRLYSNANPGSIGIDFVHVFDTTTHTWLAKSGDTIRNDSEMTITADYRYLYANRIGSPNNVFVFDIQTDTVTRLYQGPHGPVQANKFVVTPDGSKIFTSDGQVWSRDMQEQIGTLEGGAGSLIEHISGKSAVALAGGNIIKFFSTTDYHLISTYTPAYSGSIVEMEVAPDGSKLITNFSGGEILVLDISNILPDPPQDPLPSTIKYEDLVADSARGRLYGADKAGNKVDIISMLDMSVVGSYPLAPDARPIGLDLDAVGNELAVAESGLNRVAFINLTDGTVSETGGLRNSASGKAFDVLYGRQGVLYALSDSGVHVINTTSTPHLEDLNQFAASNTYEKFGAITPDKNTLFFVTGSNSTGDCGVHKFDVSIGLSKPTLVGSATLYNSGFKKNLRLSMVGDSTLLTSWGNIYNVSDLSVTAKNGQSLLPVIDLPSHSFYAVVSDVISNPDTVYFLDKEDSYKRSSLSTDMIGTPGAMAASGDGSTLFISSTGGMAKFDIGVTPPGMAIDLPQSLHQYRDFAFDMPRGVMYGTDASNRIDVIDQNTGSVLNSYLLPNGTNPIGIDLSPNGNELAIAGGGLEKILYLEAETGETVAHTLTQPRLLAPYDVSYGRVGRLYAVGSGGGSSDYLHAIDSFTHSWLSRSVHPNYPSGSEFALTDDNKYLYASGGSSSYLFDVQTDTLTAISRGNVNNGLSYRFTIIPDGSKMLTNIGEVWSSNLKEQRGSLEGGSGSLIEYIYGQGAVAVAGQDSNGSVLRFISDNNYRLLTTYRPTNAGTIVEMESAPDGSKLVVNFSSGDILILSIAAILPVPPSPPPTPALSTIQYEDLVVDEARGKLYGVDQANSKIDVINMSDMYVSHSYLLPYGALPTGMDLGPDGDELAVAQSGLSRVTFIDLGNGTISEIPAALSGSIGIDPANPFDVIYGRVGVLYALSRKGIHVINTFATPHVEDAAQYVARSSNDKFGTISADKNTLFFTSASALYKFNVSAGLTRPTQVSTTYIDDRNLKLNIRLSLADDSTLLTSWGNVYDTALIVKAKNGQRMLPVIALPGRSFYASPSSSSDLIYFLDEETSHQLSSVNTGRTGLPGAMAVTGDGNTLFFSSTGGMTKFEIGVTPPGTTINPPPSLKQYRDFAFDPARYIIFGTDASGRVDVLDQSTGTVVNSFLLPNGANPIGIDLSPDGNELAVALNGLQSILFLDSETGVVIARVKPLNNDDSNVPYDVIYGRSGRLYSDGNPSDHGFDYLHVVDTTTHTWLAKSSMMLRTGAELAITSDHKYLYANETFSPNNIYVVDVQTDTLTKLYEGPHGPVSATKFAVLPDGSNVFTSNGQVWSGNMQTQLGTLQGAPGTFIKFIPNKGLVALASGNAIKFISASSYQLVWTHYSNYSGAIVEMEVAPDGSKLIANHLGGNISIMDLTDFPPPTSTPGPGPSPTPRPSSTPGPSPTSVPSDSTGSRRTYSASGTYTYPGTFLCDETQTVCTNGADLDADNAHRFAADTFVFYNTHHARNSFDNQGGTIISTVNFGIGYQNAVWTGAQMVYGDNMAADDVVGHELTHGVTQYTSGLIYSYQSGAINESFSDVWGEFIDQTNGSGNDSLSVKWLMGEDTPLGAIRSMSNPPAYANPDKMSSPYFYVGSGDNGGVHINSGVNNKAAYLMVEGGAFNGRNILGIGLNKTAAVYYEAQVYHLTMGANYNDLYYALLQACQNLIGGTDGITLNDCEQVKLAAEAVEMIPTLPPTPTPTFTPTDTPTYTPTFTPTNTPTETATATLTHTPTPVVYTLVLQPDAAVGVDSYIYSAGKNTNYGTASVMGVGEDNNANNRLARGLIKFDLSSIPANATIDSATLSLWTASDLSSNNRTIRVYRLNRAFNEMQATWNVASTGVNWQTAGASGVNDREGTSIGSVTIPDNEALNIEKQIVLNPSKIQEMVSGTFLNRGFIVVADTESNDRFNYQTSDSTSSSQRPKLVLQYTVPDGVPSNTPTATAMPSQTFTPSITPTASVTPSPTATASRTPTASLTASFTPTVTRTPTSSSTPSMTGTSTNTASPTDTATATPTVSVTPSQTATVTSTYTPVSPTATLTSAPPSATFTPTFTSLPPTATHTSSPTPTNTATAASGFPSTTVLDNFNRINGAPGKNWSGVTAGYGIVSNRLDVGTGDALFWRVTSFGTHQEAFVTLTTIDPAGSELNLLLKSQSSTTWSNGVIKVSYNPVAQTVQVWTYSSAQGWVQRGADIPVTFANGDQFGARARSNGVIEIYRNGVLLGSCDASGWTYSANGGYIGLWFMNASNSLLDDVGGGTTP